MGALRTVLFDFLLAKQEGGELILRIEDTDRTRYNADSEKEFIDTLSWVGIDFNEGPHIGGPNAPYRQSERKESGIYAKWINVLLDKGHAYKAFETPEELDEMREYQQMNKLATGYFGGKWRDASPEQVDAAIADGKPFVIRQRIPRDTKIVTQDRIRGRVEVDSNLLTDPVLIKADGMPTYHFAAMVDDHEMGITHVLRGEEWLPSFPMHWMLFEQFGWEKPVFVHCAVIVGNDGKKLSKRHGATRVLDYGAQGYLKSALKNFIALIGWSPGEDREVMSEEEMIQAFSLDGLQASPGRFDIEKLAWLNGVRIRSMSTEVLLDTLLEFATDPYTRVYWEAFVEENPAPNKPPLDGKVVMRRLELIVEAAARDRDYVLKAVKEAQERVVTLADFGEALEFFMVDEPAMDEKAVAKWFKEPHVGDLFDWIIAMLPQLHEETPDAYQTILKGFQEAKHFEKLGPVVHPTRVALTGKTNGPGLFELMAVLGPERIKQRLERAKALL